VILARCRRAALRLIARPANAPPNCCAVQDQVTLAGPPGAAGERAVRVRSGQFAGLASRKAYPHPGPSMGSVKREDLVTFSVSVVFSVGGRSPPICPKAARAGRVKGGRSPPPKAAEGPLPRRARCHPRAFTTSVIPMLAGSEVRRAEISAMRPPSIRAGAKARAPGAACAQQLSGARLEEAPHLSHRAAAWTAPAGVRAPLPTGIFEIVEVTSRALRGQSWSLLRKPRHRGQQGSSRHDPLVDESPQRDE
jgi:hypothetical protein